MGERQKEVTGEGERGRGEKKYSSREQTHGEGHASCHPYCPCLAPFSSNSTFTFVRYETFFDNMETNQCLQILRRETESYETSDQKLWQRGATLSSVIPVHLVRHAGDPFCAILHLQSRSSISLELTSCRFHFQLNHSSLGLSGLHRL